MERRKFLWGAAAASAASVGAALEIVSKTAAKPTDGDEAASTHDGTTLTDGVSYSVSGFTCVTCAVGLEVMLKGLHGVRNALASYEDARVIVDFDRMLLTEATLKEFVTKCGFSIG
jgi:copper chaperone CopZ